MVLLWKGGAGFRNKTPHLKPLNYTPEPRRAIWIRKVSLKSLSASTPMYKSLHKTLMLRHIYWTLWWIIIWAVYDFDFALEGWGPFLVFVFFCLWKGTLFYIITHELYIGEYHCVFSFCFLLYMEGDFVLHNNT